MSNDYRSGPRGGRRVLLGLAASALPAVLAHMAVGRAASGEPLVLGSNNNVDATTALTGRFPAPALIVENRHGGGSPAVVARTGPAGRGFANPESAAVVGQNRWRAPNKHTAVGVWGEARGANGVGVFGRSPDGVAVAGSTEGTATREGANPIAVKGESGEGTAGYFVGRVGIEVHGLARFTQAGRREVPEGVTTFDIEGAAISPEAAVLATIQGADPGVWVTSARPLGNRKFRVFFSGPVPEGGVTIGYLVVN